jgi:hypothetical protein
MPPSQGNIGHRDVTFFNAIRNLNRFEAETENPRVGGSIPPLATTASKFPLRFKSLHSFSAVSCSTTGTQNIELSTMPRFRRLPSSCTNADQIDISVSDCPRAFGGSCAKARCDSALERRIRKAHAGKQGSCYPMSIRSRDWRGLCLPCAVTS